MRAHSRILGGVVSGTLCKCIFMSRKYSMSQSQLVKTISLLYCDHSNRGFERLSNHIFLKTKHPQGFVCKRTSVAEWLEFWNCNSEAPNLRPALTAGQLDNWFPSCHLGFFSQVMFHLIRPFVLIDHVLNLR